MLSPSYKGNKSWSVLSVGLDPHEQEHHSGGWLDVSSCPDQWQLVMLGCAHGAPRCILDEAQSIRNARTLVAKSVLELRAERRRARDRPPLL